LTMLEGGSPKKKKGSFVWWKVGKRKGSLARVIRKSLEREVFRSLFSRKNGQTKQGEEQSGGGKRKRKYNIVSAIHRGLMGPECSSSIAKKTVWGGESRDVERGGYAVPMRGRDKKKQDD